MNKNIDLTPYGIESRLKLRNPIYSETSSYGHMGRLPKNIEKVFYDNNSNVVKKEVELFTWEKLDLVNQLKNALL